ncbi:MAG TPA: type VI secretion system contractile sheath large subunit [Pirellulaceae bacterium]|nr:type VI secretion system contractile sheath large subunit [Pirellulaceae bacterium]
MVGEAPQSPLVERRHGAANRDDPSRLADASERARTIAELDDAIWDLDDRIERQLNEVLAHPKFLGLQSRWFGLANLVEHRTSLGYRALKVKFLDASWNDLIADLKNAAVPVDSQLWHWVYRSEYDTNGGEPFGLMLIEHPIGRPGQGLTPTELRCLEKLATIFSEAFCPVLLGIDGRMFGVEIGRLDRLSDRDLRDWFGRDEFARWRELRARPETRFIGLVLPRIRLDRRRLAAAVEAAGTGIGRALRTSHDGIWVEGFHAFAAVVMRAFVRHGWFAELRGFRNDADDVASIRNAEAREGSDPYDHGGLVPLPPAPPLPTEVYRPERARHDPGSRRAVETAIDERRDEVLADLGFVPIVSIAGENRLLLLSNQSLFEPRAIGSEMTVELQMSSMLQYTLCISRFAHRLKGMMRRRLGSGVDTDRIGRELERWLSQFVLNNDIADAYDKSRKPLRRGAISIREAGGKGNYAVELTLQPHDQYDRAAGQLTYVTRIREIE